MHFVGRLEVKVKGLVGFGEKNPRLLAAVTFLVLRAAWAWYWFNKQAANPASSATFGVLPAVSSVIAAALLGYLLGNTILDPNKTRGYLSAAWKGACINILVALVYLPVIIPITLLLQGNADKIIGSIFFSLLGSMVGIPIHALVGGVGGILLYCLVTRNLVARVETVTAPEPSPISRLKVYLAILPVFVGLVFPKSVQLFWQLFKGKPWVTSDYFMVGIYNLPVFLALSIYLLVKMKSISLKKELYLVVLGLIGIWLAMAIFARFFLYTQSYYGAIQIYLSLFSPLFNFGGLLLGVVAATIIFDRWATD